ncbi:MAG: hypothetical protein M1819_004158 [Sarea resinae]|nr:MAG: hypothetical protein M1819_004158 [Sarea resinae]
MTEVEKYEVLEKIGHGSFGIIRKVKRKSDGYVLCRKEITYSRMSPKEREQLNAEFQILSSLRHPNIVAYYHREHLKASQDLYLYMEYCGNGDLGRVIKSLKAKNQFADEAFVWSILTQLVSALYRCHYGVDPPEVGKNVFGKNVKQGMLRTKQGHQMILHRDLKPENGEQFGPNFGSRLLTASVFLGADNSVKLGDFGLSKIMQSHDFASTYVGTPFYMSPEICASERYTHHSDIWALGCIIYELCAQKPPFSARNHVDLVQKIRAGRYERLPPAYSEELQTIVKECLRINPMSRPDTAQLLEQPMVRLMRKEKEVVDLGRVLKSREEVAVQKLKEVEEKASGLAAEQERMRQEIEAGVRREWELKARLEIDRQVALELEKLRKQFDVEVRQNVEIEMARFREAHEAKSIAVSASSNDQAPNPLSSVGSADDTDFPSSTDITDVSLTSHESPHVHEMKKSTRTPFGRAQTMWEGSPMDIQMKDRTPASIVASMNKSVSALSLSPRKNGTTHNSKNIFTAAAEKKWEPRSAYPDDEYDEDDEIPAIPSPTRQKPVKGPPRGLSRPGMLRQQTAPMQNPNNSSNPFLTVTTNPPLPTMRRPAGQPDLFSAESMPQATLNTNSSQEMDKQKTTTSPTRRTSKPSVATSANESGSPVRKAPPRPKPSKATTSPTAGGEKMLKAVMQRNMGGRTLVELAQARVGNRPPVAPRFENEPAGEPTTGVENILPGTDQRMKRQTLSGGEIRFAARMAATEKEVEVVWDPERDEMPSPFLVRGNRGVRRL